MTAVVLDRTIEKDAHMRAFTFDVALQRCYKEPDGTMHVIGVASDDLEDRVADRMSSTCVKNMAKQCTQNNLQLLDNHKSTFGFGKTYSASAQQVPAVNKQTGKPILDKSGKQKMATELVVDFALDGRYPQSKDLFDEVQSGKSEKQLSIGGYLDPENPDAIRFEKNEMGNTIRVIEDIRLEHIAATRPGMAAVPRTKFVDAIIKDIFGDQAEEEKQMSGQNTDQASEQAGATAVADTPAAKTETQGSETKVEETPEEKAAAEKKVAAEKAAAEAIDPAEMAQAAEAVKRLAAIGKLFAPEKAPEEEASEELKALDTALTTYLAAQDGQVTDKSMDTVRRVQEALTTLLSRDGATGVDPEADTSKTSKTDAPTGAVVKFDGMTEAQLKTIADAVDVQVAARIDTLSKHFDAQFTGFADGIASGLEGMAVAFKEFVETQISGLEGRVAAVSKSTDSRLSPLEKAAGTSQRIQGSEPNVATGKPPAEIEAGQIVNKRAPDKTNLWRGMFDPSVKQQLARRGGR